MSQPTPTTTRDRRELRAWRNAVFVIFILSGLAMATWVARTWRTERSATSRYWRAVAEFLPELKRIH